MCIFRLCAFPNDFWHSEEMCIFSLFCEEAWLAILLQLGSETLKTVAFDLISTLLTVVGRHWKKDRLNASPNLTNNNSCCEKWQEGWDLHFAPVIWVENSNYLSVLVMITLFSTWHWNRPLKGKHRLSWQRWAADVWDHHLGIIIIIIMVIVIIIVIIDITVLIIKIKINS